MIKLLIILLGLSFFLNIILIFKDKIINFIFKKFNYYFTLKKSNDIIDEWLKDDINIGNININNLKGGDEDWKKRRIR